MPRSRDLPCAGCGELMWRTPDSLPEGEATCHPCRRKSPEYLKRHATKDHSPRLCPICRATFTPRRTDQKYCGPVCHGKRKRDGNRPVSACDSCGTSFTPVCKGHRFCSAGCRTPPRSKVRWVRCPQREHWATEQAGLSCSCIRPTPRTGRPADFEELRPCVECGSEMRLHRFNLRRLRCDACLANVKRREKDKRRALKRDAYRADVSRAKVFERDRYRCQLCGKKLNMNVVAPHPKAPTIDHIVPLAQGGLHEPSNAQAAHFLCNSIKGDRGGNEQLLLIG